MKARLALYALCCIAFGWLTACSDAQVNPNPTTYSCPATNASLYAPLNQASPATTTTYTDTKPAAGVYCYVAQSVNGNGVSLPSNVAGPFTLSGSNSVRLSWTAPSSGVTPAGYVLSRAAAVSATINAPTLGTATVASARGIPAFPLTGKCARGNEGRPDAAVLPPALLAGGFAAVRRPDEDGA